MRGTGDPDKRLVHGIQPPRGRGNGVFIQWRHGARRGRYVEGVNLSNTRRMPWSPLFCYFSCLLFSPFFSFPSSLVSSFFFSFPPCVQQPTARYTVHCISARLFSSIFLSSFVQRVFMFVYPGYANHPDTTAPFVPGEGEASLNQSMPCSVLCVVQICGKYHAKRSNLLLKLLEAINQSNVFSGCRAPTTLGGIQSCEKSARNAMFAEASTCGALE